MAIDKETERSADSSKLAEAIDLMLELLRSGPPKTGDKECDDLNAMAFGKVRIEAAKALPALFARRAALLGLDQQPEAGKSANQSGSLAELEQKLALSDRLGKGVAS